MAAVTSLLIGAFGAIFQFPLFLRNSFGLLFFLFFLFQVAMAALAFCLGGPHGHSDAVRARADITLRLSACVLNHEVGRPL